MCVSHGGQPLRKCRRSLPASDIIQTDGGGDMKGFAAPASSSLRKKVLRTKQLPPDHQLVRVVGRRSQGCGGKTDVLLAWSPYYQDYYANYHMTFHHTFHMYTHSSDITV